ncbi:MAG: excinuclease ABC subunit UvrC [bacterium]|nr:excinuclease ABC subunit UvrC [bacterium]
MKLSKREKDKDSALSLREKLDALPKCPGVYLFKDAQGNVIYIGKAKILRARVRQYFQNAHDGRYQFESLVRRIADVEVIATDTELEALILENTLIRDRKPRYNIDLRDDKSFPFLRITNEPFPRAFLIRRPPADGSRYFGPFSDLFHLRGLLHVLRGLLKIRTCNLPLSEEGIAKKKFKSCLEYHIGRCNAPCIANESCAEYAERIRDFTAVVSGRGKEIIARLRAEMDQYAADLRFEQAAQLRDWLSALDALTERQKVISAEPINRDVIGIAVEDDVGCAVVLQVRSGRMVGRLDYRLKQCRGRDVPEILGEAVERYYSEPVTVPDEIFLPTQPPQTELLHQWLKEKRDGLRVEIRVPARGEKAHLVELAARNAELLLTEYRIAREKNTRIPGALAELRTQLSLPTLPRRMIAFDISTLMGTDKVASMVVFHDGRPAKSHYRCYRIQQVEGMDDFASMREAVLRRFRRLQAEGLDLPDLVLIDGGKGQLAAALEAMRAAGAAGCPVIGLAKRLEEVYRPDDPEPHYLPRTSSALRLLQQIRDEAHRFAITYHRKLRQKRSLHSLLEDIGGVGPARRKALLTRFPTITALRRATVEEIATVPGLSLALAARVHEYLQQTDSDLQN